MRDVLPTSVVGCTSVFALQEKILDWCPLFIINERTIFARVKSIKKMLFGYFGLIWFLDHTFSLLLLIFQSRLKITTYYNCRKCNNLEDISFSRKLCNKNSNKKILFILEITC